MEQENEKEKELDQVIKNSMSSMTLFKRTSVDDEITDKQEALIFKLLEQEQIYLLENQMIVRLIEGKKPNRKQASAIIAYLFGLTALRGTFQQHRTALETVEKDVEIVENLPEEDWTINAPF